MKIWVTFGSGRFRNKLFIALKKVVGSRGYLKAEPIRYVMEEESQMER